MMHALMWRAAFARYGIRSAWRDVETFARLQPPEQRRQMATRLMAQLKYFGNRPDALPQWREAARITHADDVWSVWHTLPVLSKQDLQTRFAPRAMQQLGVKGRAGMTGGSTGEPTPYLHDEAQQAQIRAAGIYCRYHMGWQPGMPVIGVWGSERDIGKQLSLQGRVGARLRNTWLVDGYCLNDATVDAVLAQIGRHERIAIYGFTSMLEFVAREVLKRGVEIPRGRVAAAWNGGEMLFDQQSQIFEKAFGVPILNYYGGRELGAMAFQRARNAPLTVLRPWLFLEVVDDDGRPVAAGETGRLVFTNTIGRGTPFLRFDIGDLGAITADGVDEAGVARIAQLSGRRAGLLRLVNGRTVNCLYWNHLFKEFPEVEQFQVAVERGTSIELRMRGSGFGEERQHQLVGIPSAPASTCTCAG